MSVLEPQDYFRLRLPSDPQISPDGRYVAYVRDWPDVIRDAWSSAVQVIDRKSGNVQDLGDGFQPRWSPESDRLAFVKAGDDANAIRLWSVATGETTAIASLPSTPEGLARLPTVEQSLLSCERSWYGLTRRTAKRHRPGMRFVRNIGRGRVNTRKSYCVG
ncbi:TolB family protein [Mesorhizobium sp. UC22_110]|uniref:TolB family protein n=1 Tax=Mesorhizobium sp. UC22_110 TaxID=3374552 RepID=UPI0037574C8B